MKANTGTRKQLINEINITPLTDVFLVLLIIMMVVAPMIKLARPEIRLPDGEGGTALSNVKLIIEVTQDGRYFLDGAEVDSVNLALALENRISSLPEKALVIRADRDTNCKHVLKVFDAAREAKYVKMTVALETLTPNRSRELGEQTNQDVIQTGTGLEPAV